MNTRTLRRSRGEAGSASIWAVLVIAGAFTMLLGLVVDGGRLLDARLSAQRAAGQAARTAADALSAASVRDGGDEVSVATAHARAERYLHAENLTGTVLVRPTSVTVTVIGTSSTEVLGIVGIDSFPIKETQTARAITEETRP